eukprot:TRINITY_DN3470_c0_g2_i1.p1 TRINITY_DN3470_c0_g2~~TRINITY_DN3470_c0_g2_i1.p1  ORF type:complete len:105 (-),score=12.09 TRINITY_DN3470_c0_g2_i1:338-652(-)
MPTTDRRGNAKNRADNDNCKKDAGEQRQKKQEIRTAPEAPRTPAERRSVSNDIGRYNARRTENQNRKRAINAQNTTEKKNAHQWEGKQVKRRRREGASSAKERH